MSIKRLRVSRTSEDGSTFWQEYTLEVDERITVVGALQRLYAEQDDSLAFRYACRFRKCGLCAVRLNGEAVLGCRAELDGEAATVEPLANMPVLRDLVNDRAWVLERLRELELYPTGEPRPVREDELREYYNTIGCLECLACHSMCPKIAQGSAGPYLFVKLAQMHWHPWDGRDRAAQARQMGIDLCVDCAACSCPHGVNIQRSAIGPLLAGRPVPSASV
ncbi:MAG: 4Fe-4S dicluster domain-containing protein [Chloroflexi bacterium]|nr:4Fe-4S dicluster domain-containing protein [Chloroflexota bacterium]